MGVSDRHYFAWLRDALERFEAGSSRLAAMRGTAPREVWVLAGARMNPAVEFVAEATGRDHTTVRFLDKFARDPGVIPVDFNALEDLPGDACDVLMMSRASYMVEAPRAFLFNARRLVRPGGVMVVDWVHGAAEAPVLDLPGSLEYDGRRQAFFTTYCDPAFLSEWPREFGAFIRHVNRPPWWTNVETPRVPLAGGKKLRRLLGGGPRRAITLETYPDALREDLERAGRHLIEPELMEEFFKVVFREARYLYPLSGKFYLYLLTVLEPVGK